MAERRMFAKSIIDSDAFLDMPLSAQALYFHLSMRADDEGFVNNPRKIQRMINGSVSDYDALLLRRFILEFESGVIVIKHWRVHNYIQSDRRKPTLYQDELSSLDVKENRSYTERNGHVSKMDTQSSLGKSKDSLELGESESKNTPPGGAVPAPSYQEIKESFNRVCVSLPKVREISDSRRRAIKSASKTLNGTSFDELFERVQASDFLTGRGGTRSGFCSFDWILKPANLVKILEGNYDNRSGGAAQAAAPRDYNEDI